MVDAAKATELFSPLVTTKDPVTTLRLSNKSYTLDAAKVIASVFTKAVAGDVFRSLATVDIADMIAGRPEGEALAVLATITEPLASFKVLPPPNPTPPVRHGQDAIGGAVVQFSVINTSQIRLSVHLQFLEEDIPSKVRIGRHSDEERKGEYELHVCLE